MLKTVTLTPRTLRSYQQIAPSKLLKQVTDLAKNFRGSRILHINATEYGGGVAAILSGLVPLLNDLGIESQWQVIEAPQDFFEITKKIHNGLQGGIQPISKGEWQLFWDHNRELATQLAAAEWDWIVVHDPQPLGLVAAGSSSKTKWIWRYHGDGTQANPAVYNQLTECIGRYNGVIYTLPSYQLPLKIPSAAIAPAIDPLSSPLPSQAEAEKLVSGFGIDPERPLVVQVGRFDPWKDPLGTIRAWGLAKAKIPDLQLVLVGNTADDDPEGGRVLQSVQAKSQGVAGLFVVADQAEASDVKAFQVAADIVLQKSLREGFALTVAEALWAKTPVIGARAGGIPLQVIDGETGYLTETEAATAEAIVKLIRDPKLAAKLGERGHALVREKFLLPRQVRDNLRFLSSIR